jgi:hypothetical protein
MKQSKHRSANGVLLFSAQFHSLEMINDYLMNAYTAVPSQISTAWHVGPAVQEAKPEVLMNGLLWDN